MNVTIRYFEGCPNWDVASDRLHEAIRIAGVEDVAISLEQVDTPEDAQRLRFPGSPTVLLDGRDPFAVEAASFGLSCRRYRTETGLDGAPSVAQLVDALKGSRP